MVQHELSDEAIHIIQPHVGVKATSLWLQNPVFYSSRLNTMNKQGNKSWVTQEKDIQILCSQYESSAPAGEEQRETKNDTVDFKIVEAKTCQ